MNILDEADNADNSQVGQPTRCPVESANPIAETLAGLQLFLPPGQVTELRALGVETQQIRRPHVVSGYFDDVQALANWAQYLSEYARGVYYIANPILPALLARSCNRCRPVFGEPLTGDADVLARRSS